MDEQELIQVNLRLPASALDGLSRLTEQLRKLTAAVNGFGPSGSTAEEIVESGSFDLDRFHALRQQAETAARRSQEAGDVEAQTVQSDHLTHVEEPEGAGRELEARMEALGQADSFPRDEAAEPEAPIRAERVMREETLEEIPVARPSEGEQIPEAPVVNLEPDSQIPEAENVWTQAGGAEIPLPTAQAEILEGVEAPLGAGVVVTAQTEPPESRWADLTEELVTTGPAPLTAEAVSLAFQRDGRRYDNGFPLY